MTLQENVPQEHISESQTPSPKKARSKGKTRRRNGELLKMGLVASLTAVALTGFKIVKPMSPVHPIAAVAFLVLTALHTLHYNK